MTARRAKPILMDMFATKATDVPPKVINLIVIVNAPAQATNPMPRKSACTPLVVIAHQCTRVRRLDCSMRFSQNAKLLSPQGLFISLFTLNQPQTASDTWHHRPPPPLILSHFSRPK